MPPGAGEKENLKSISESMPNKARFSFQKNFVKFFRFPVTSNI
jgi:hypothetical protein